MSKIIDELLKNPKIKIKNPNEIGRILQEIITGGAEKLQVISDYDRTLTKHHEEDGKTVLTSAGIFRSIPELQNGYAEKANELYRRYHPYEVDPVLTLEEKTSYVEQWYRSDIQLLVGCQMSADNLKDHVNKCDIYFRDGTEKIFPALLKAEVPVLVFSAGLGDVVKVSLEKHNMLYSNVRIISNFLEWDSDGKILGFKDELIHVFNKNQRAIASHEEYFSLLSHRPNVILLGDNDGDADMGHGVRDPEAIIKIGFLDENIDDRLDQFMDLFDIVIMNDQSMTTPIQILQAVIGNQYFN